MRIYIPILVTALCSTAMASQMLGPLSPLWYDTGQPTLTDIWVDPANGRDRYNGSSRDRAVRTLGEAWLRIPQGTVLKKTGYRILLAPGDHPMNVNYWASRWGTAEFPVVIQAADGPGTATIRGMMNVYDCRYLYLIDVDVKAANGDVIHLERCDHVLLRRVRLTGVGNVARYDGPKEALKANQSRYLYVEDSDLSNAYSTALDFVAVQYGHIVRSKLHQATGWCAYIKGGSAGFRIEGNEIYDCGEAGFSAGQGTGFEFMVAPWLHYEAYDIRFVNNVIHDVRAAGMCVFGGYNVLLAYNTLYRVGELSHAIHVGHGNRGCDGSPRRCQEHLQAGGWGVTGHEGSYIPSRNVYIYNNLVYNPEGYHTQWQHLVVEGAVTPPDSSQVPAPSLVDLNLQIRGNVIWNGPAQHRLGLGGGKGGCRAGNPTCNPEQVAAENVINKFKPELFNPAKGEFAPVPDGALSEATTYPVPDFPGGDLPERPAAPPGDLANITPRDRNGDLRLCGDLPGAYISSAPRIPFPCAKVDSPVAWGEDASR